MRGGGCEIHKDIMLEKFRRRVFCSIFLKRRTSCKISPISKKVCLAFFNENQ